ncbi:unnamed protein product, partial [Ostreobium quekettii]
MADDTIEMPPGAVEVGRSRPSGDGIGVVVALRTLEIRDKGLLACGEPEKMHAFVGRLRRVKDGQGVGGHRAGNGGGSKGEPEMPVETDLVVAGGDTVRMTLRPWIRDVWRIRGGISGVGEGEEEVVEALGGVFCGEGCKERAGDSVKRWYAASRRGGGWREAVEAGGVEEARNVLKNLEMGLDGGLGVMRGPGVASGVKGCFRRGEKEVSALEAVQALQTVRHALGGVLDVFGGQGSGGPRPPGLFEIGVYDDPVARLKDAMGAMLAGPSTEVDLRGILRRLATRGIEEGAWEGLVEEEPEDWGRWLEGLRELVAETDARMQEIGLGCLTIASRFFPYSGHYYVEMSFGGEKIVGMNAVRGESQAWRLKTNGLVDIV